MPSDPEDEARAAPDARQADRPARAVRMGLLARADGARLCSLWDGLGLDLPYRFLRKPETGLVMVRGRAGGTGAPFNLGEMTVTRCSVLLGTGEAGHACVAGRSQRHAEVAALVDAAAERADLAGRIAEAVLAPLEAQEAAARARRRRETAATRVAFDTIERERR